MLSTHSVDYWATCLCTTCAPYGTHVAGVAQGIPYHHGIWRSTIWIFMFTPCALAYICIEVRSICTREYVVSVPYIFLEHTTIPNTLFLRRNTKSCHHPCQYNNHHVRMASLVRCCTDIPNMSPVTSTNIYIGYAVSSIPTQTKTGREPLSYSGLDSYIQTHTHTAKKYSSSSHCMPKPNIVTTLTHLKIPTKRYLSMAWYCSGSTNTELVDNLFKVGLVKNEQVKNAMVGVSLPPIWNRIPSLKQSPGHMKIPTRH